MKAEAEESLREIKISEWVDSETLTEYSPAGSVVLPAAKSKGMFTATASCACAIRVDAIAVRAITPAITKALVFMGHSFFSRWLRPSSSAICLVRLIAQRFIMVSTFAHSSLEHNARGVNRMATLREQVSAGK